jgi:peptidoglycan hydrolase-like protein with peptidoglycan-binding domain
MRSPSPTSPTASQATRRFAPPWPTDDPGLTRAERRHLQQLLLANGYNIGEADGKIGLVTRTAIADAERRFGMPHRPAAPARRSTARSAAGNWEAPRPFLPPLPDPT